VAALLMGPSCGDITSGRHGEVGVAWRTALASPAYSFSQPDAGGGRVYAPHRGVTAFDAQNGRLLWTRPLAVYAPRNVVLHGGRVFAAESVVFAFDAATGAELWRFRPDSSADYAQAAADDGAFYVGTRSHRVYALRAADGVPLWSTDLGADWLFGGLVTGLAVSGDTVYAAAERPYAANGYRSAGVLVALDRATGRILWTYQNGDGSDLRNLVSSPAVAGGLVLASDRKGNALVAVDRATGLEAWRVPGDPGFVGFTATPVVVDGIAYAASGDRGVYAIRVASGEVVWKTYTPAANDAVAVCGSHVLAVYQGVAVLDRATGQLQRKLLDADDDFVSTGVAVDGARAFALGNRAAYGLDC
jgi:outer membrane protein assembly factor BamB